MYKYKRLYRLFYQIRWQNIYILVEYMYNVYMYICKHRSPTIELSEENQRADIRAMDLQCALFIYFLVIKINDIFMSFLCKVFYSG